MTKTLRLPIQVLLSAPTKNLLVSDEERPRFQAAPTGFFAVEHEYTGKAFDNVRRRFPGRVAEEYQEEDEHGARVEASAGPRLMFWPTFRLALGSPAVVQ